MVSLVMATTALGAGALNFPAAYDRAGGILIATIMQLVTTITLEGTILVLAYCSEFHGDCTYDNIVLSMCGPKWRYVAAVSVIITCYGVCVTYLLVMGDQFDRCE